MPWWVAILIAIYVLGVGILAELANDPTATKFERVAFGLFWPVALMVAVLAILAALLDELVTVSGEFLLKAIRGR